MSDPLRDYLGDSVYVQYVPFNGNVVLTTENGLPTDPSNEIELDEHGLAALNRFVKRMKEPKGE